MSRISLIAGGLVILMGGLALAGWMLDITVLASLLPGLQPMSPMTAVALMLAGVSLATRGAPQHPTLRGIGQLCASLVALIGGLKLMDYLLHWNSVLEIWLFAPDLRKIEAQLAVRVVMAPATALNFLLLGGSLLMAGRRALGIRWMIQGMVLTAMALSLFSAIGYVYAVEPFDRLISYIPMAFSTALAFLILGAGVLWVDPDFGLASMIGSEHSGGALVRRLLPIVVLVPILLGWLRLQGQRLELYEHEFGLTLFATSMVLITALLLLWNGWSLSRSDRERRRADEAWRASEERFRQIAEHTNDVLWIATTDFHQVLYVSPAYEAIWGRSCRSLYARPFDWIEAIHPDERNAVSDRFQRALDLGEDFDVEYRIVRPDGAIRHIHDRGFLVRNSEGQVYRIAGVATDITDRKLLEARLQQMAHYDALTGLPNRLLFQDRLEQALARAKRRGQRVAVLYYDVDQFKQINDEHGHEAGDQLLKALSERLAASLRDVDTLSRLGGDEFAVVLPDIEDLAVVPKIADKLLAALAAPFHIKERPLIVTVSIGISLHPDHGEHPEELVKHADAAMYQAKQRGRNNYQFYSPIAA
ncbi:MAG: diguanylate cyclase [Nitrospirota bacterium]